MLHTKMRYCHLTHMAAIGISGNDSKNFLQGQLSCDLNALEHAASLFGAHCNRKGKMIYNFVITATDHQYYLCMHHSLIPIALKTLKQYAMFSKIDITIAEDIVLIGYTGTLEQTLRQQCLASDLQPEQAHHLCLIQKEKFASFYKDLNAHSTEIHQSDWERLNIQANIAFLCEATSERFLPQMISLDTLGGVSFNKGCYLGQEIVARSKHLGKIKQKMVQAQVASHRVELGEEQPLIDYEKPGIILSAAPNASNTAVLAIIRL